MWVRRNEWEDQKVLVETLQRQCENLRTQLADFRTFVDDQFRTLHNEVFFAVEEFVEPDAHVLTGGVVIWSKKNTPKVGVAETLREVMRHLGIRVRRRVPSPSSLVIDSHPTE